MSVPSILMEKTDALALANEVSAWLKERLDDAGAERFVFGLSGGIDSAVVAGLCARAAGPDRVIGIIMPSASNPQDVVEADKVAGAFGIHTTLVDLTTPAEALYSAFPGSLSIFDDILNVAPPADVEERYQLAMANVRPRLRMLTNYYIANMASGLVVGTGNKTESLIGYFTKFGDGGVDIMAITDLYKYEVRSVAKAIGVPESVINRPPSAGLWEGQTDEEEIGLTYDQLDSTLEAIESGDTSDIDPAILTRVERMVRGTAHKRTAIPQFKRSPRW